MIDLSKPSLLWGKTGLIAHVSSPSSSIEQKIILARHTAEATCRFGMGYWCQNTTHSRLIFGLFNSWVLRTSLMSQRSHASHKQCLERLLAHSHWYLRPIPTDYLPILSCIQPVEFRRLGATLSFDSPWISEL